MVLFRFAPSPTGALHLGGLRTALFNYLAAKQLGGKWILRIEDTDRTRYIPNSVENIQSSLRWAGLDYDYGPGADQTLGPYYQSERLDLYRTYSQKLLESNKAYRCFCKPDRLLETKERLKSAGSHLTYDRACLHLSEEDVARRLGAGHEHVIRFNSDSVPSSPKPHDLIFGDISDAHASLPTDPILVKTDLFPTYHLASVVDDHQMGITHVLRGEEWLPSLPLHLDLYTALSITPPKFGHLPILLNPDGTKMSKRSGDVQVTDYIKHGWEPSAVLYWLMLAGWRGRAQQSGAQDALINDFQLSIMVKEVSVFFCPAICYLKLSQFDLNNFSKRRSTLDPGMLSHLNALHLKHEDPLALARRVQPLIKVTFPQSPTVDLEYLTKILSALSGRITVLNDIMTAAPYFFISPDLASEEAQRLRASVPSERYSGAARLACDILSSPDLQFCQEDIDAGLKSTAKAFGGPSKHFWSTLRHAVTGMKASASMRHYVPECCLTIKLYFT
ncbi:hypothetical protein SISSUDRAFT_1015365 [Sistotremastrum suecicum HHB10207 ss-3]|uniref:glutamate--tRNA ligase n=1 Tax=Sistotremastrum suecicum HHB10207 ss-3 TaxID=1314776 RepID=A0A166HKK3_9AGAM|nr:hypothetical protein SISSUDRAFT_1015365 [Sistotremastrum suecicum HHB10207 ss-3]